MAELPDEIWLRILETGVRERGLTFKDLCCLSISCRRLDRLAKEEPFWLALLAREFPLQTVSASKSRLKDFFRIKFERHKALKLAAHRREVLKVESRIASGSRELHEANCQLMAETGKLDVALRIKGFEKSKEALRQRLDASKEYLSYLKYHPLRSSQSTADNKGGKVKWEMGKLQGECSGDKVINQEEVYPGHNVVRKS